MMQFQAALPASRLMVLQKTNETTPVTIHCRLKFVMFPGAGVSGFVFAAGVGLRSAALEIHVQRQLLKHLVELGFRRALFRFQFLRFLAQRVETVLLLVELPRVAQ